MRKDVLALAAIGLALTACQQPGGPESASFPAADAAAATAAQDDAEAEAEIEVAPAPEAEDPVAAVPPEPVIEDDPRQLLGLDRAGLDTLLGQPAVIRREPPAEIWQYRGASCVFDVFLYEDAGSRVVNYFEARDATAERVEARACLNQLLRARLDLPLG